MGTRTYVVGSALIAIVVIVVTLLLVYRPTPPQEPVLLEPIPPAVPATTTPVHTIESIGTSVNGRDIMVTTFGDGDTHILFVGGIHGGYEWNSVVLAEEAIAYFTDNPDTIPVTMKISVIPNLNPDGVFAVLGMTSGFTAEEALAIAPDAVAVGRFNTNNVDLNRNFDCKWAPTSTWRGAEVSAGTAPFSEPEAQALRDYVLKSSPDAVVFWHSRANTVYASECHAGVLPETRTIMDTYANAASYGAVETFDAYPITGDAEGWLASLGIPAITVELESRDSSEWVRNLNGILATLHLYERNLGL